MVVADIATCAGFRVLGYLDANPRKEGAGLIGFPVIAADEQSAIAICRKHAAEIIVGVGDNRIRKRLFETFVSSEVPVATIIHPRSVISSTARIGIGTVVGGGVCIDTCACVGRNVIVNMAAIIGHEAEIGDHAHLSGGSIVSGGASVGEGTLIASSSAIRSYTRVGAWCVVGVGAAVVKNLPDGVVAYGVPARAVRPSDER